MGTRLDVRKILRLVSSINLRALYWPLVHGDVTFVVGSEGRVYGTTPGCIYLLFTYQMKESSLGGTDILYIKYGCSVTDPASPLYLSAYRIDLK